MATTVYSLVMVIKKKVTIRHDGFVHLPNNTWKGAGVAIPVFSLRSKNSAGVGEFLDIKLLVDWAVLALSMHHIHNDISRLEYRL